MLQTCLNNSRPTPIKWGTEMKSSTSKKWMEPLCIRQTGVSDRSMLNFCVEELSDYENQVDENEIEPDYFIDRPPSAVYIPDEAGHDKFTAMDDRVDPDLFNFDQEVKPVLEVLVGKALELAQIEVLEQEEEKILANHKRIYKQRREAELLQT